MGKKPQGWALRVDQRTGNYTVRFRAPDGRRVHRSTGTADRKDALRVAAALYEEHLTGRPAPALERLFALWLAEHEARIKPPTLKRYAEQVRLHIVPFFETYEEITDATVQSFIAYRLKNVKAATVNRELTVLRQFLRWSQLHGFREHALAVPSAPQRAAGTKHKNGGQRTVELSPEQVAALLEALPEVTPRGKAPARDFVRVVYETALRYRTVAELEAPRHYRKGRSELVVTDDIDKAGYGRTLPLTPRAREALDRHAPRRGLVFGRVDLRAAFKAAGRAVGLPEEDVPHLSFHDFRHARLTEIGGVADLPTTAFIAGHKHVTTTSRYVHPHRRKAEAALAALAGPKSTSGHEAGHGDESRPR
ncbi:MAG: tyrosine-type recombinase/integrase [Myxococcota bacterium]